MTTNDLSDEERARLVVRFKAAVLELAQRGDYNSFPGVVIASLLDVAEGLMRRAVRADPSALPPLLARIEAMRAHCADVVSTAAAAAGPTDKVRH